MREKLVKKNTLMSILTIFVAIIVGFIVPKIILTYYGSEVNGLVSSINQFLNFITILEAGVGAVIIAKLYEPFAKKDYKKVSCIISKSKNYFFKIIIIYIFYVIFLAWFYPRIAESHYSKRYITLLVLILGLSLFIQYCFTVNYSLLLQAAQKNYICSIVSICLQIINAIVTVVLVVSNFELLVVKCISALIFLINPIILSLYIKKQYPCIKIENNSDYVIPQKKETLVHNITYIIHSNTDIVLITLFLGIEYVSVYAIYNMVIFSLRRLMDGFTNGIQAAWGDMLAKNEITNLKRSFVQFEHIIIIVSTVIFTICAIMIVPFVLLYTKNITDISYYYPMFAYIFIMGEMVYCYRIPYHTLVKAGAYFKETRNSAMTETVINIVSSLFLINYLGLCGVALGTFFAMTYRTIYYIRFFRNKVVFLEVKKTCLLIVTNFTMGGIMVLFLYKWIYSTAITVLSWVGYAVIISVIVGIVLVSVNMIVFPEIRNGFSAKIKIYLKKFNL